MSKVKKDLKNFLKEGFKSAKVLTEAEKEVLKKNLKNTEILPFLLSNSLFKEFKSSYMFLILTDEKEKLFEDLRKKNTYNEKSKDELYFLISDKNFENVSLIRKIYTITPKRHKITCEIKVKHIAKKIRQDIKKKLIYSFVKEFLFKEPRKIFEKTHFIEKFINYFLGIAKDSRGLIDFYRIMEDYNKIEEFDKFDYTLKFMNRFVLLFLINSSGIIRSAVFDEYKKFPTTDDEKEKFNLSHMLQNIETELIEKIFSKLNQKEKNKPYHILKFREKYNGLNLVLPYLDSEIFAVFNGAGNIEEKKFIKELFKRLKKPDNREIFNEFIEFLGSFTWTVRETPIEEEELLGIDPEVLSALYEKIAIFFDVYKREKKKEKLDEKRLREVLNQYIANKGKGVYFTPRVITQYITENTIIPWIKDRAKEKGINLKSKSFEELKEELGKLNEPKKKEILNIVKEIKILDPAVGSGGFLQPAGDILFEIRKKLDKDFDPVITTKEIVVNNLYGVDILEGAIEICRLRMWLWILSKANEIFNKESMSEDEYERNTKELVLPNIEYNFEVGNSLIGYINPPEVSSLFSENSVKEIKSLLEKYREGNIEVRKEIENKKKELKKKLDKILIDEIKGKKINITEEQFVELKPFHWIIEFPEVMVDRGGFDVVVGNPPYVENKKMDQVEKGILKENYISAYRLFDYAVVFIERSYQLLERNGFFSYIVTNKFISTDYGAKLRELILKNTELRELLDVSHIKIFKGIATYPIIIVFKKTPKFGRILIGTNITDESQISSKTFEKVFIPQSKFLETPGYIFDISGNLLLCERIRVNHSSKPLGEICDFYYRILDFTNWVEILKFVTKEKPKGECLKFIGTPNITQFVIDPNIPLRVAGKEFKNCYLRFSPTFSREAWNIFKKEKLLVKEVAKVLTTAYDRGEYANLTGMYMIIPKTKISLFYLLGLLNSKLLNFYFRSLYGTTHMAGGYLRFNGSYLKELPIYISRNKKEIVVIDTLSEYIYTLKFMIISAVIEKEDVIIQLIFELKKLLDISIYELYFKEKFAEDGLYSEPKEYLLKAVSKHLRPINYDRWAELYWKKQLENKLTPKEEKELQKLETQNLKTIHEVYESLKNDKKIEKLIQKIKSHKWVKIIEGKN